ncbi:hypothetical protein D6783_05490 [Candidatus Woesearchaeota archaeon]|nr:MAG: hypothetical protein D6783_05490 [Candidatus Woesearchaeota archaeon]
MHYQSSDFLSKDEPTEDEWQVMEQYATILSTCNVSLFIQGHEAPYFFPSYHAFEQFLLSMRWCEKRDAAVQSRVDYCVEDIITENMIQERERDERTATQFFNALDRAVAEHQGSSFGSPGDGLTPDVQAHCYEQANQEVPRYWSEDTWQKPGDIARLVQENRNAIDALSLLAAQRAQPSTYLPPPVEQGNATRGTTQETTKDKVA